jgi:hypothetical protein
VLGLDAPVVQGALDRRRHALRLGRPRGRPRALHLADLAPLGCSKGLRRGLRGPRGPRARAHVLGGHRGHGARRPLASSRLARRRRHHAGALHHRLDLLLVRKVLDVLLARLAGLGVAGLAGLRFLRVLVLNLSVAVTQAAGGLLEGAVHMDHELRVEPVAPSAQLVGLVLELGAPPVDGPALLADHAEPTHILRDEVRVSRLGGRLDPAAGLVLSSSELRQDEPVHARVGAKDPHLAGVALLAELVAVDFHQDLLKRLDFPIALGAGAGHGRFRVTQDSRRGKKVTLFGLNFIKFKNRNHQFWPFFATNGYQRLANGPTVI